MRESTIFSVLSIVIGVVLLVLSFFLRQSGFLTAVAGISGLIICGVGVGIGLPVVPGGMCPACGGMLDRFGVCAMCERQISPRMISRRFWKLLS